jgi:hypothetical protein
VVLTVDLTAAGRRGLGWRRVRNDGDLMSSLGQRKEHGKVMLGTRYNMVEHGEGLCTFYRPGDGKPRGREGRGMAAGG